MGDYSTSSHKSSWIFTPIKLAESRRNANATAVQKLERYFGSVVKKETGATPALSQMSVLEDIPALSGIVSPKTEKGRSMSPATPETPGAAAENTSPFLTAQEELLAVRHYCREIRKLCLRMRYKRFVMESAVAFFLRFYTRNSVHDFKPSLYFLTATFLACKAEENYVPASSITKAFGVDAVHVVRSELTLMEGIRFHLHVWHPQRPLEALLGLLKSKPPTWVDAKGGVEASKAPPADSISFLRLSSVARALLDACLMTDLTLTDAPANIALGAVVLAARSRVSDRVLLPSLLHLLKTDPTGAAHSMLADEGLTTGGSGQGSKPDVDSLTVDELGEAMERTCRTLAPLAAKLHAAFDKHRVLSSAGGPARLSSPQWAETIVYNCCAVAAAPLLRRLESCCNPETSIGSKEYEQQRGISMSQREAKRVQKIRVKHAEQEMEIARLTGTAPENASQFSQDGTISMAAPSQEKRRRRAKEVLKRKREKEAADTSGSGINSLLGRKKPQVMPDFWSPKGPFG